VPTYRLDLEYEGTRYHGWQEQQNARSIAGELKRAVTEAGGDMMELGGAGRTDAGVHALAQTAHLRLRRPVNAEPFRRAVNEALPADIHVLSLLPAADAFHARHDAVSRVYLYQVSRRRAAHAKRHVWWVKRGLDHGRMADAASRLEGRHDYALFCERAAEQTGTLVVLEKAEVAPAGALILVRLTASHFLWKMVRRVVGVLVRVGSGESQPGDLDELLAGRLPAGAEEGIAKWTAPAAGLFLERVIYPGEAAMPPIAPLTPVSEELRQGGDPFTGRVR
jgi:tRNA pseudouridine38-40 synthase